MKDTKSEGHNKDKFYASFRNRTPGSPACWIEVTVVGVPRKKAREIAQKEVAPLPHFSFMEID